MEKDHTTKVFVVSTKIFVRAEGKPNNRVCGEAERNSRACFSFQQSLANDYHPRQSNCIAAGVDQWLDFLFSLGRT
jgi:hypothetical protein